MTATRLFTAAILYAALICPALAGEPRTITFSEAIAIALEQNTTLRRTENETALDRIGARQAALNFLPDLRMSVSGSRRYQWWSDDVTDSSGSGSSSSGSLSAGLSSGLTLFDGLANVAELREARLKEEAGRKELDRARQTVVFQVLTGYLAMIEAQEQQRVREENLSAQEDQEREVQAQVDGGTRPISDLYQQQANVAAARLALVEARQTYEMSCIDLVQLLQLDPKGTYVFEVPPLPEAELQAPEPDLVTLLDRALVGRPDLDAATIREEAAGQRVRMARAGYWPSLSLSAGYGVSYSDASSGDVWDQFEDRQSGSLGLSLSLPLFDRLTTRHQVEQARINTANARLTCADLRQEVALQVRRAVLDVTAAREQLRAADAGERAARQALAANEERYAAGASTLFEVSQSRADWVAAASERVRARYNLLWQERVLEYYVGTLDPAGRLS